MDNTKGNWYFKENIGVRSERESGTYFLLLLDYSEEKWVVHSMYNHEKSAYATAAGMREKGETVRVVR